MISEAFQGASGGSRDFRDFQKNLRAVLEGFRSVSAGPLEGFREFQETSRVAEGLRGFWRYFGGFQEASGEFPGVDFQVSSRWFQRRYKTLLEGSFKGVSRR